MDQAELDEQDRFDRREKRAVQEKQHRALVNTVLRASRKLRDASGNIVREDDEASDAWRDLDSAFQALDSHAERVASGVSNTALLRASPPGESK